MNNFLTSLIIFLVPFSYYSFYELRVILLLPIVIIVLFLVNSKNNTIIFSKDLVLFLVLLFILNIYVFMTKDFLFSIPVLLFFLFTYWFVFLGKEQIKKIDLKKIIKVYIFTTFIFSIVLFIQVIMYFNGYVFGKIEVFGGHRFAFYVIWNDSSFLSLYLASVVPLLFYVYKGSSALFLTIIFLIASVITSARTGVFSLLIITIVYLFIIVFKSILELKIKRKNIFFLFLSFFLMFLMGYFFLNFGIGRFLEGDNGRFQTYINSFNTLSEYPLFGTMYSSLNTVSAHNFIIHTLVSGGILFFLPYCLWLYIILKKLLVVNSSIANSILVCFIGLNFIPSFFSAYFFGFLLSIMLINYQQIKIQYYDKVV